MEGTALVCWVYGDLRFIGFVEAVSHPGEKWFCCWRGLVMDALLAMSWKWLEMEL